MLNPYLSRQTGWALGVVTVCLALHSQPSLAGPWIDTGDTRARHHLQRLSDAGHLNLPLTTWPLMWSGVSYELDRISPTQLSEAELWSYQYLKHEARRARRTVTAGQQLSVRSSHAGVTDFGSDSREGYESRSHGTYTGERLAVRLQLTVAGKGIDDQRYRADGSFIAGTAGNWAIGAGSIDRWWGPGWQSSLILSNNARPTPGLFISRVNNAPSEWPILKWLGPWDLRIFLNQLESNRGTPEAKLFGMRATFKPFRQLEVGLSRTAQWGGEGRPQSADVFWNMLIGQDNRGGDGIKADMSNEPGNQLGGVDWRLSYSSGPLSNAFYGQLIGEDEAGGLPSHLIGLAGLETSFMWGSTHNRLALEATNSTMEFTKDRGTINTTYEHPLYPSGYRYRGRPMGTSMDNDSEFLVLKGFHDMANGHHLDWSAGAGDINSDGTNDAAPGGNVFGQGAKGLRYLTMEYSLPITSRSLLSVGGEYYNETLEMGGKTVESGVYVTYRLRL